MTYDIYESKVQDIINLFSSQKTMTFMQNSYNNTSAISTFHV
jgi:hypothetical protein